VISLACHGTAVAQSGVVTRFVVLAALILSLLPGVATAASPRVDAETEHELVTRINRERAARGLDPVKRDASLSSLARFHSADMALSRFVAVVSPGAGALAERVMTSTGVTERGRVVTHVAAGTEAAGGTLGASILDPAVTRIGVGVVTDDDGRLFLTEVAVSDAKVAPTPVTYTASSHAKPAKPTRMESFTALLQRTLVRLPARLAAAR
jgi:uncharacterized protein YkwD